MWLSRQRANEVKREGVSAEGTVTANAPANVYLEGERREIPVFAPGGYCWRPGNGQNVLVLKTGDEGEQPCVIGTRVDERELKPGEVSISAGDGEIRLKENGEVALKGTVKVNGVELRDLIEQVLGELLG